jgi:hypothetical protein
MSSQINQLSPEIQKIIKHRDQTKTGAYFYFPDHQRSQIQEWETIKIICENFKIVNNQSAILKPESNSILIHPTICSFASKGSGFFATGCFQHFNKKSIEIPNSITSLGDGCFSDFSSLTRVSLPNSITSLGDFCFNECSSLKQISLPNSITSLGDSCFRGCSSLTQISLPNSITSLSQGCFYQCSSLTQISLPNSITSLGDSCFCKCKQLFKSEFPNSLIRIYDYSFDSAKIFPMIIQNQLHRDFGNYPFKHSPFN